MKNNTLASTNTYAVGMQLEGILFTKFNKHRLRSNHSAAAAYLDGSIKRSMKEPIIDDWPVRKKHDWHDKSTGKLGKMGLLCLEAHKAAFAERNAKKNPSMPTYFYRP